MNSDATSPSRLAALYALLDQGLAAHAPEYDHGLSNHLPMLLHALQQLGASPQRLQACAEVYAHRLKPRAAAMAPPAAHWTPLRGQIESFEPLRAHFSLELTRQGREATLRETLPLLMPGVGAGAFHGLIRTAHALEAGHDGELAAGLAYWAAAWLPLRPAQAPWPQPRLALPGWLAALQVLPAMGPLPQNRIVARLRAVAAAPGFDDAATALQVDEATTLRALAQHAAALYAATGNFTVLHAVTACRAMTVLLPWMPDPAQRMQAAREFALALGAALHAARLSDFDPAGHALPPEALDWPALRAAAIAADDDHTAKLVQACWQLDWLWPAQVWAQAAARRVLGMDAPGVHGFDHVHVHVADRAAATAWYGRVLGMRPVAALSHWAADGGPLVLADAAATVHLALFERAAPAATAAPARHATVALALSAAQWPAWRAHLAVQQALAPGWSVTVQDHGEAWSIYFRDPDGNPYELTCYEVAALRAAGNVPA